MADPVDLGYAANQVARTTKSLILYALAGLLAVTLVFQSFFRYEYVTTRSGHVIRIDRLKATACVMPCLGTQASMSPTGHD